MGHAYAYPALAPLAGPVTKPKALDSSEAHGQPNNTWTTRPGLIPRAAAQQWLLNFGSTGSGVASSSRQANEPFNLLKSDITPLQVACGNQCSGWAHPDTNEPARFSALLTHKVALTTGRA